MQTYEEKDTKENDQKVIGEAVIEEILNKNNFKDFKTKLHNKNSKCGYRTNKTTTIKLNKKEAKEESAESLIVAAHEASHALNYREGITNAKLIKFTELSSKSILLIMLTASAILSFYNWQYSWLVLILLVTSFFFITKFHFKYYIYDETKTEERALEEIKSVWGKVQTDIKFEEVKERNKTRLEKNILGQIPLQRAYLIFFTALSIILYLELDKIAKFWLDLFLQ